MTSVRRHARSPVTKCSNLSTLIFGQIFPLRILGASTSWSPRGLPRPVERQLYRYLYLYLSRLSTDGLPNWNNIYDTQTRTWNKVPNANWRTFILRWRMDLQSNYGLDARVLYSFPPLFKKDNRLFTCFPPSILVLYYVSPIFRMSFSTSSCLLALGLPLGHFWCKLAWYIYLMFLASSTRCTCPTHLSRCSIMKVPILTVLYNNSSKFDIHSSSRLSSILG